MNLLQPISPATILQRFNENANPLYASQGLKGHGALDYAAYYGQPIFAAVDSYIYSDMNFGAKPDVYRAVCTLVEEGDVVYEIIYGHVIDSPVEPKTYIKAGQLIARAGNFGNVYTGGVMVTLQEKLAGSHAGTHLHFQVRLCKKVLIRDSNKHYIKDSNGYVKLSGMFIEIVDFGNGYNGCIDPLPFFSTQSDEYKKIVTDLQKYLEKTGELVMPPQASYGHIGPLTIAAINHHQN